MSGKQKLIRIVPLVVLIFSVIYYLNRISYNKAVEFYNKDLSSEIKGIEKSKLTRSWEVYYGSGSDYFNIGDYKGVSLKIGDSIKKLGQEIKVFRKGQKGSDYELIGVGNAIKPAESFWDYFLF